MWQHMERKLTRLAMYQAQLRIVSDYPISGVMEIE